MIPQHPALAYRHQGVIDCLQQKSGLTQADAVDLFEDLVQFLYLCGTKDRAFVPSRAVDEAWHHFVLFTRDYENFCWTYFGRFIHHEPEPGGSDTSRAFEETLREMTSSFGSLSRNWDRNWYCRTVAYKSEYRGVSKPTGV